MLVCLCRFILHDEHPEILTLEERNDTSPIAFRRTSAVHGLRNSGERVMPKC